MLLLEYNTKNLPLSSCPASANGNHVFSQPQSEFWFGWHFLQSSYEVQNATKRGRSRLKSYFCANESPGCWICQGQAIWDLSFKLCNVQAMSLLSRNFLFPTLLEVEKIVHFQHFGHMVCFCPLIIRPIWQGLVGELPHSRTPFYNV